MKSSPFTHRFAPPVQVYRRPRRWPTWARRSDVQIFALVTVYTCALNAFVWFVLIPR